MNNGSAADIKDLPKSPFVAAVAFAFAVVAFALFHRFPCGSPTCRWIQRRPRNLTLANAPLNKVLSQGLEFALDRSAGALFMFSVFVSSIRGRRT